MLYRLNNLLGRMTEAMQDTAWLVFRILVASMYATHGYEKLLGENPQQFIGSGMTTLRIGEWLAYPVPGDINLLFVAGVLELAGGALLVFGLWTHLVAFISLLNMSFAYLIAHLAWFPTLNNGELAALYWCAFLALLTFGGGQQSLDAWLTERRMEKRRKKMDAQSAKE